MTETPSTDTASDTAAALDPNDPRMGAAAAVMAMRAAFDGVRADQLDQPTPCDGYTVRQLMGHAIVACRRLAAAGNRVEVFDPELVASDVADDAYPAALEQAAHEIMAAWSDDALLTEDIVLPFATMPGAHAVGMYAGEFFTHTWDLAVATGQTIDWPDAAIEPALFGAQMGLPAEGRDDPLMPFGPVVAVANDAPAIERLVAWSGRNPNDWPSAT